jgi:hypothetical protein
MKKTLFATLALFIATSVSFEALAASNKMVFWYPGEAGSTEEAQPTLDAFFEYIKENVSVSLSGAYYNTVPDGMSYIKNKKPAIGILSNFVWETQKTNWPNAKVFLATLPLPNGTSTERYALVGLGPIKDGSTVYSSEPIDNSFVIKMLFNDLPSSIRLKQTGSIMQKLKGISQGTIEGYAILTPMEAYTLGKLKSPWAQKLKTLNASQEVPSARLILFDPGFAKKDALTETLIKMKSDPAGQEILDSLRLTGFAKP